MDRHIRCGPLKEGLERGGELPILEERYQRLLQHFRSAGVAEIEAFVKGDLGTPQAEVAVIHAAVGAMKDIKRRADFEVYLKKFLQSLNLILPHTSGHPFRGPARRFRGQRTRTSAMITAPIAGPDRKTPKPSAPTFKISDAKAGNNDVAPPKSTANKSSEIAPNTILFDHV